MCAIICSQWTAISQGLCELLKPLHLVCSRLPYSLNQAHKYPELESKQVTLIEVVQSLGEYINDEDATIRSKAVSYLSQVVGSLQPAFLARQQVQVLCQFLCDRIEDGGAVSGLTKLQGLTRLNKEMAVMTLRA